MCVPEVAKPGYKQVPKILFGNQWMATLFCILQPAAENPLGEMWWCQGGPGGHSLTGLSNCVCLEFPMGEGDTVSHRSQTCGDKSIIFTSVSL